MGTRAWGRAPGYRGRGGGVSYNVHEGQGTRGTILSDWEVWCILTTGGCLHGADIHSPAQIANPGQGEPYTMPPGSVGQVVNQERRVLDMHPTGGEWPL